MTNSRLLIVHCHILLQVDEHDLVAVGGAAHGVAMGGWHLGGGHSPMTRTHGLGVDQVISFRVHIFQLAC